MKLYTENQFIEALSRGQYDFSDSEFVGQINATNLQNVDFSALPRLIFDRCNLGSDFSLGRFNNQKASLSMVGAISSGRVSLFHLHLYQLNLSTIEVSKWLAIMHCETEILCLAGAKLPGGFITKGSRGGRLDLTGCNSGQSLFTPESWRTVEVDDALLGKLEPTRLGELTE